MHVAVAITNLILGIAYTGYGVLTVIEMKRGWKTMGFSHFGAAWIFMAFTCGPHHLDHGLHSLIDGRSGGLDLYAVLVGLPVGVIWLLLRIEAMGGGRGDRFITGTPTWLLSMPTLAAIYLTTLAFAFVSIARRPLEFSSTMIPNALLLVIYMTIGYFLFRTQLRNRPETGGWSASGLSLAAVFPTCGIMHVIFATYVMTGLYVKDVHGFIIDWLAVPAGAYFLWVVQGLYRERLRDWNMSMPEQGKAVAA
jgi:hypothetical protein